MQQNNTTVNDKNFNTLRSKSTESDLHKIADVNYIKYISRIRTVYSVNRIIDGI